MIVENWGSRLAKRMRLGFFVARGGRLVGGGCNKAHRMTFTALTVMKNLGISGVNPKSPVG